MIDRAARFATQALRMRMRHGARLHEQLDDYRTSRRILGTALSEFYDYRLWDRSRSAEERLAYLTFADRRIIEGVLNPVPLQRSLLDKLAIAARMMDAGIAAPEVIASYHAEPAAGHPRWPSLHGREGLSTLAAGDWPDGVVIKPNDGGAGRDVCVFQSVERGWFHTIEGRAVSVAQLATMLGRRQDVVWKVERRVLTHHSLRAVIPDVPATTRVMSFRHRDGRAMIGPAAWKVPRGRSGVDNYSRGSLAAPIDWDSGAIGAARRSSSDPLVSVHPDTGVAFDGMMMPYWSAVKAMIASAFDALPGLHGIGWDVGVTDAGPVIIEANPWWGGRLIQVPHNHGLVEGAFAELLSGFGLGELVDRRELARPLLA